MNKDIIIKEAREKFRPTFGTDVFHPFNEPEHDDDVKIRSELSYKDLEQWLKSKLDALETATLEKAKEVLVGMHHRVPIMEIHGDNPITSKETIAIDNGYMFALAKGIERIDELTPSTNTNPVDEESKEEVHEFVECFGNHGKFCKVHGLHCTNKGDKSEA